MVLLFAHCSLLVENLRQLSHYLGARRPVSCSLISFRFWGFVLSQMINILKLTLSFSLEYSVGQSHVINLCYLNNLDLLLQGLFTMLGHVLTRTFSCNFGTNLKLSCNLGTNLKQTLKDILVFKEILSIMGTQWIKKK